ncbi:MAG: flagellin [Defluviitaleaceae bacterium]|nr:flagellin [Defluviitaleaceae bacterium]
MVVRTNMLSLNAHRNVKNTGLTKTQAAKRLGSGYRVNTAADDAAGLAISENMRAQIRGLDQASRNTQDGVSLIQTAEGALQGVNDKLGRIRELMVQAANDTYAFFESFPCPTENPTPPTPQPLTQVQREMIQHEINQLMHEINQVANRVEFNGMRLLDGSAHPIRIPAMNVPSQSLISDSFNLITGVNGSHAQIESLYDELGSIPFNPVPPAALPQLHRIANELGDMVNRAHDAFVHIINTVNGFISTVGDSEFAPDFLYAFRDEVAHHLHGEDGHLGYHNAFLQPALYGTENAQLTTSPDEARRFLLIAFNGAGADLPGSQNLGGAFGSGGACGETGRRGVGLVFCHNKVVNAAWELLDGVDMQLPHVPGFDGFFFQIGANSSQGMQVSIAGISTLHLGDPLGDLMDLINVAEDTGMDISAQLRIIDHAIPKVLAERAKLGAVINRLEFTMRSLDTSSENLQDSESRIRNADMAKEMMTFHQQNVLQQAGLSILAQANQVPNGVLELLR